MASEQAVTATLLVNCRDRTGLVAALSSFVFSHGGNILDADQHAELDSGEFFMRLVWDLAGFSIERELIRSEIASLAQRFELKWELTFSDHVPRMAVFATKASHCLYDLLLCQQIGDLGGKIVAVISNHDVLADVCKHFEVPFSFIPVDRDDKRKAEQEQLALLDSLNLDVVGTNVGNGIIVWLRLTAVGLRQSTMEQVDVTQEIEHEGVGWVFVDLIGGAGLLDFALVHDHDPVGHLQRLLLVVGHEYAGDVDLVMEPPEPAAQLQTHLGVERSERFVQKEHLRFHRQGAREGDALALAAG